MKDEPKHLIFIIGSRFCGESFLKQFLLKHLQVKNVVQTRSSLENISLESAVVAKTEVTPSLKK